MAAPVEAGPVEGVPTVTRQVDSVEMWRQDFQGRFPPGTPQQAVKDWFTARGWDHDIRKDASPGSLLLWADLPRSVLPAGEGRLFLTVKLTEDGKVVATNLVHRTRAPR
jgi:hypothetical protein